MGRWPPPAAQTMLNRATRMAAGPLERRGPRAAVLLYHRVSPEGLDPLGLCVSPEHFREHMEVVRAGYRAISLGELIEAMGRGSFPDRAVAVTFDDGYADNLHHAAPALEAAGVPFSVFVTSGFVGSSREFWWDELERLLLEGDHLPARLTVTLGGRTRRWPTGRPQERVAAHAGVARLMGRLSPDAIEDALVELRRWRGEPAGGAGRESHRALTVDELRALAAVPGAEIGAHTRRHPNLRRIAPEAQEAELATSKRDLEEWLGRPVRGFAYPFGHWKVEYDRTACRLAQRTGFSYAAAVSHRPVTPRSSTLRLPRATVNDGPGAYLARRLEAMLG